MTFFVSTRNSASDPFRVVYREVKLRTSKGYPLIYEWKALPEEYAFWEDALAAAEKLNGDMHSGSRSTGIFPISL